MRRENLGIEIFRCWLMFLIVLMHCATFVPTGNPGRARLVHTFCMFAVNGFVLISGWFGVRFSAGKALKLLGLGLYSAVVLLLCSPAAGSGWFFSYYLGWFGSAYLGLLCFAPILNAAIDGLRTKSEATLRMAWSVYAVMMLANWLPIDWFGVKLHVCGWEAQSFNQLCFMYVSGRVLARCEWVNSIRLSRCFLAACVLMGLNYAWAIAAGMTRGNEFLQSVLVGSRGNNNPLIIGLAVAVFIIFLRAKFPNWLGRTCAFLGPSMFSIYLLHEGTNYDLSVELYSRYLVPCRFSGAIGQIVTIFSIACCVYIACLSLDLLRRIIVSVFSRREGGVLR